MKCPYPGSDRLIGANRTLCAYSSCATSSSIHSVVYAVLRRACASFGFESNSAVTIISSSPYYSWETTYQSINVFSDPTSAAAVMMLPSLGMFSKAPICHDETQSLRCRDLVYNRSSVRKCRVLDHHQSGLTLRTCAMRSKKASSLSWSSVMRVFRITERVDSDCAV